MSMPIYLRVAITIMSTAALLVGSFLLFVGLIFFGNFNFSNTAHLGIFAATLFSPVFVASCWLYFQVRPSTLSAVLTLSSYAMTALAWLLWSLPAARGLIH